MITINAGNDIRVGGRCETVTCVWVREPGSREERPLLEAVTKQSSETHYWEHYYVHDCDL
jgi:hypothetical protein